MVWTIDEFMAMSWWELRDFCEDRDVYPDCVDVDNLVDAELLSQTIAEWASHARWQDISYALRDLDWNGDYGEVYEFDGDEAKELKDSDLAEAKEEILQILHDNGEYLDGEYDEDEDEEEEEDEDEEEIEFSVNVCNAGNQDEEFNQDTFMSMISGVLV